MAKLKLLTGGTYQGLQKDPVINTRPNEITIWLPFAFPSLNVYLRSHWRAKNTFQNEINTIIKSLITRVTSGRDRYAMWTDEMKETMPWEKAQIYIIRFHQRGRPLDKDNLYGAHKPLLDAIVKAGIIKDDDAECLDDYRIESKKDTAYRTRINIRHLRHL